VRRDQNYWIPRLAVAAIMVVVAILLMALAILIAK